MSRAHQAIDQAIGLVTGSGVAFASVLSIAQESAAALFGVPIGVVIAAFGGTVFGLSFRDPMSGKALAWNLGGTTLFASTVAPLIAHFVGLPVGLTAGLAGLIAFGLQYAHSWMQRRRDRLLDGAVDRVLGPVRGDEEGRP